MFPRKEYLNLKQLNIMLKCIFFKCHLNVQHPVQKNDRIDIICAPHFKNAS